jgi:ribonuclease HII
MPPETICGVDEAGRGPLCGPVLAAAVILDPARPIEGLTDSKKLSARTRERLAGLIRERALDWSVAEATAEEIDRLNILQASLLAMRRAIGMLKLKPTEVRVDGNRCPDIDLPVRAIVGGDALEPAISAASILAKTMRDARMIELDRLHPQFGLAQHKGYPTAAHLAAIRRHGIADFYRKSFAPVRQILANPPLWTDAEPD